jgi:hypothetical protein
VPGEFFFMAIGGLGISLAGFAGLIAALTPEQQRGSPIARWRIAHVVQWGLHLTFLGFGVVTIYALTGDATTTARISSLLAAVVLAVREWRSTRPGPAWPQERLRRTTQAVVSVSVVLMLGNVAVGSVGNLHVIMLLMLLAPAMVFVSAVRDATAAGLDDQQEQA